MDNKRVAMVVLAVLAVVALTASGAYATGLRVAYPASTYPGAAYGCGVGPAVMGGHADHCGMTSGYTRYSGGMMGGYGMMGDGPYSMPQYMWQWWNSTSAP